ncbi:MAG: zinc-ribbon domain containing protein [Vulcanimicrobiaceae bacterium]
METKVLTCKDCARSFDFTVRDQQFYAQKGFTNEPQRCKECRDARKAGTQARQSHEAVCAQCNVTTTVPFKPRGDRPIYCRSCFAVQTSAPALV